MDGGEWAKEAEIAFQEFETADINHKLSWCLFDKFPFRRLGVFC
jgi:hypothetical protein